MTVQQLVKECFHSRGQYICKFTGTKESVCIRKELNSHRTGLGHQHGRRDVMWKHSIVNYTCALSQSESGKYFEWIINKVVELYRITLYRPIRLTQCCTQFKPFGNKTFCSGIFISFKCECNIIMQIQYTKNLKPERFELGTTLS